MRAGELCAGYGGLMMAIEEAFNASPAWVSEYDPAPSKVLAYRYPTVPNHGDMTKINWYGVEPVEVLGGGTPCQDLSTAGARRGMTDGTRSNLWVNMREAIAVLRPKWVVWENVRGAYSAEASCDLEQCPGCVGDTSDGRVFLRALGRVLGDLSDLGYDAQWRGLRAADVGAPHGRFRVFVLARLRAGIEVAHMAAGPRERGSAGADFADAYNLGYERGWEARDRGLGLADGGELIADAISTRTRIHAGAGRQAWESPGPRRPALVSPGDGQTPAEGSQSGDSQRDAPTAWGDYEPAIRRWEARLGRPAPRPTEPTGRDGNERLSPRFTEWMMGLPEGWVTDPAIGISRNEQLKACGNGVVPQQAMAALRDMLAAFETAEVAA